MAQKILLTGGAGYIGSHTYVALIEAGYEVVIIDNFSNAQRSVADRLAKITGAPVPMVDMDVRDAQLFAEHRIDAVVHFAAMKSVGESVRMPLEYLDCNVGGLLKLMQAMAAAGVFRLVFSSSATVYGTPERLPIPETAPRSHTNPYGYSKIVGEDIIAQAASADDRADVIELMDRAFDAVATLHPDDWRAIVMPEGRSDASITTSLRA